MENIIRKKLVMTGTDTDFVAVKQYENNYTRIVVEDFTPEEGYNYICVYKKLDHFGGCHRENVVYEVPFVDNTIYVDNYITNELGTYLVAIVAINANDETIAIGSPFRIEVIKGVYTSNTQAPSLPEPLESKYQQLVTLIDEVTYKLNTGGFDGFSPIVNITNSGVNHYLEITDRNGVHRATIKDGDDYVITDADYETIAEMTTQRIQPTLDKKMEYYKVVVHGNTIYHDEEIMTFNKLVELYNDISVFLYMECSHLTLIPNSLIDNMLTFGTAYFNTTDSHIYQVDINANNEVVFHSNSIEVETNKINSINTRNKNSEKYYPSIKALTTYVDNGLALKADKTELETEVSRLEDEIAEKGKVDDVLVNGVSVVNDKVASLEMYSKAEIDAKIEQAKPADYEQLKEKVETHDDEIAFLKWAVKGEYTEVVDNTEAYEKQVPNNVYSNALLNKMGGKSVVLNQLSYELGRNSDTIVIFEDKGDYYEVTFNGISGRVGASLRNDGYVRGYNVQKNHIYLYYAECLCVSGSFIQPQPYTQNSVEVIESGRQSGNTWGYAWALFKATDDIEVVPQFHNFDSALTFPASYKFKKYCPFYDLTLIYGAGNEPTTLAEFLKVAPKPIPYTQATLYNAEVNNIVSMGKNLCNGKAYQTAIHSGRAYLRNYEEITSPTMNERIYYGVGFISNVEQGKTYYPSTDLVGYENRIFWALYESIEKASNYDMNIQYGSTLPITPSQNGVLVFMRYGGNEQTMEWSYAQLEVGTNETDYTPYFENIKPISAIVEKYFPNGMKSVGSVYDEIDLVNGKAIQRVDSDDLSIGVWGYNTQLKAFVRTKPTNCKDLLTSEKPNFISEKYDTIAYISVSNLNNNQYVICGTNANNIVVKTNGTQDIQPIGILYYELSEYIETPIEKTDIDYLEALLVESNGTITFEQESVHLPIPNEESYIKKVD